MKKYKIIFLFLVLLFCNLVATAQILDPVKWTVSIEKKSNTEAVILFTAKMESGWHIYGINPVDEGPIATSFTIEKISGASLVDEITAKTIAKSYYDEMFAMQLTSFENEAVFVQKIKIEDEKKLSVTGYITFMCCNDESCLPPKKELFSVSLNNITSQKVNAISMEIAIDTTLENALVVVATDSVKTDGSSTSSFSRFWNPVEIFVDEAEEISAENISWMYIFFAGFLGGLLALFTPCIWPIIPMTVSFFLKQKNHHKGISNALLYGFSIILIYVCFGLLVTIFFGANALNNLSTNAILNVIFCLLMIVFAISFLGYFDLELPESWSTAINRKAENTTGIISILLMAFVLVIVSFSCTGPIIGTLLVEASSKSIFFPIVGMFGFSLALSLPFSLCAIFPSMISSLPRSGSWMNTLKIILAFIELAFALKFLSVADLTSGWGILPRWLFISLWIGLALAFALYLLGVISFPTDSSKNKISLVRRIFAIIPLLFAGYMITGFLGNPLKQVSAFLPPIESKTVFYDYDKGMKYAEKNQKPVFVDFTGYGCVNCRKMEAAVFANPEVKKLLSEFVIITLYVDERTALEQPISVTENGNKITLTTVGEKWSYLQREKFSANAQPFYVPLDNDANPLASAYSYNENVDDFIQYLKGALINYADKNESILNLYTDK